MNYKEFAKTFKLKELEVELYKKSIINYHILVHQN